MTAIAVKQVLREHRGILILLLLFAVPAVLIWGHLLFFQQQLRDRLYTQWTEKRQHLHDFNPGTYQRNQDALNKLLATVPARNELPRILGQVTDYIAIHKATTEMLSYKPIRSSANGLQSYNLSITVRGSYEAVKPLLADLQNLNVLAYVDSFSLVNPDPLNDQLLMDARMVITMRPEGSR
jgi:Tfp pilus assembly protein PilO